jgi:hypothetical protein
MRGSRIPKIFVCLSLLAGMVVITSGSGVDPCDYSTGRSWVGGGDITTKGACLAKGTTCWDGSGHPSCYYQYSKSCQEQHGNIITEKLADYADALDEGSIKIQQVDKLTMDFANVCEPLSRLAKRKNPTRFRRVVDQIIHDKIGMRFELTADDVRRASKAMTDRTNSAAFTATGIAYANGLSALAQAVVKHPGLRARILQTVTDVELFIKLSNPFLSTLQLTEVSPETTRYFLGAVKLKHLGGMVQGVTLAVTTYQEMARWYTGEITTKRLGVNLLANGANMAGGIVGCKLGGTLFGKIGALGGPLGAGAGAVLGCVFGGMAGSKFADEMITQVMTDIFGIDRSSAVENALRMFDVDDCASIQDVNRAYRRLSLQYHPDKNPQQTDEQKKMWLKINGNLEVLRARANFGTELRKCKEKRDEL